MEDEEFFQQIAFGDESWIQYMNTETKERSKQWIQTHSPDKLFPIEK